MVHSISELEDKDLSGYQIKRMSVIENTKVRYTRLVAVFEDNKLANDFIKNKSDYKISITFALTNGHNAFLIPAPQPCVICMTVEEAEEQNQKYIQSELH